ncbi:transmembrane protein 131 isoform X2 [Colletes gigas]|uniref:transmembrane protein 131 isoform X2 n=1 Tax=Colletes gigas TaxID=935657 RepID=UPI001C9B3D88|nr:transmembrane protein 131 isoform X2 [Colletes gigas]
MTELKVLYCILLLTFFELTSQIRPSLHGHNNAFVQDDNDVQYLLDNIPMSMRKDFTNTVHGAGDTTSDEDKAQDSLSHVHFEPHVLDFKERQLGIPHQETVILFNKDHNKTIHLLSISGSTRHFYSSFFRSKVIPPLGNTTFDVVFLGREEGDTDTHLVIHTADGSVKYQVKGFSVSSPYRLRPLVGVKLPLNATFTPRIYMHNPHAEALQVLEIYSSGGEFQLELPSGEAEGSRELWEIPPYQTKPIIRLHFNAYTEKNHTAYIRLKVNNTSDVLVVTVEVEVKSEAGLHWGGSTGVINLGMGGSLQPAIEYPIALKNSAKKSFQILNIINTPVSEALKLHFKQAVIPRDANIPIAIGALVYDWKTGLELQHFKGKLVIKAVSLDGSSQKLTIPWIAQVLHGGLEVNASTTHYCSLQSNQVRNFSVVNKYKLPLAITNVTMTSHVKSLFMIKNFIPRVLKPKQKVNIFSLQLAKDRKVDNVKMKSSILIHSNVSITEVPLFSYDGKVIKIIPEETESDEGTINFGTVGSGTQNEAIFALENQNPINIDLHGWGVNISGTVLELMGCQRAPVNFMDKELRNITTCSHTANFQHYIKPGYLAIFKIKVKIPMIDDDIIVGDIFVKTDYERFILPVYMRVAYGSLSLKKLIFTDCFPGSICVQQVKVYSTFVRSMQIIRIAPVYKDNRIKYIPLEEASMPIIKKGENYVGSIRIEPSITCRHHCYLGLSLESNAGKQWLNTLTLPSHTRDSDLNLLNTRYTRFLNSTGGRSWENITMRLDTTEVRGHTFHLNIKPYWPSLLSGVNNNKNKVPLVFPLTQVGNTSYSTIKIHNPSTSPLIVQLVMDWNYPQGTRLYHSLPAKFKFPCVECGSSVAEEFKLEENVEDQKRLERTWDVTVAPQSIPLYLKRSESRTIRVSYTPFSPILSSALLYIRNNMTILEVLRVMGQGATAQFRFGNRKPGSTTPLLFELADKHLKDCERERFKRNPVPNLTVKRSFMARNTGELPIEVYDFYINGLQCEGYGFKVLNCMPFKLSPNATKKIEIAFTPDFTLSRIERKLLISTSLGSDSDIENGVVTLNLLATLPPQSLEDCTASLARPSWEYAVQWAAMSLSSVLLIYVLAISFLEADRILRGALASFSRESVVQPPFDLRLLSHMPVHSVQESTSLKEKLINEEKQKVVKKEDSHPDWALMNVKKYKDNMQKGLKIPDWSAEEERRFKLDTEAKDLLSFKRCDESTLDNSNNVISNIALGAKKRNSKKQNNAQDVQTDNCATENVFPDIQGAQEKKYTVNAFMKSSPVTNRKGKSNQIGNVKEETKLVDHEVQVDTTGLLNNARSSKLDSKRKQSTVGNSNNNHVTFKKFESNGSQRSIHLSEEETSSTTTESSVQDDPPTCKNFDQPCGKSEKLQRKPVTKKTKPQSIAPVPCVDYRDNYEGDCDDDEYDKERQNNPNRWKTSTTRSTIKHHIHTSRTVESSFKLPRQNKNPPRKDKGSQKRRGIDKAHAKTTSLNGSTSQREDPTRTLGTISAPLPPPPSCWGENRARFSDVVARNQESISPFPSLNKLHKPQTTTHNLSMVFANDTKDVDYAKQESSQELMQSTNEYRMVSMSPPLCVQTIEKEKTFSQDSLKMQNCSQHSNSYFMNAFTEPPFERELVPYDDLPETDEPLMELESPEEDTRCQLWEDNNPVFNLLSDGTNGFQLEPPKSSEKPPMLTDTLRDNWATVETNWEPLYTRAAVGEERSGVWGVNTGGVWAAGPWGAATPPVGSQLSSLQTETDSQERSGFDPFRSLSTIWTPSSTESWKKNHED